MPDELGSSADTRSIEDIITRLLMMTPRSGPTPNTGIPPLTGDPRGPRLLYNPKHRSIYPTMREQDMPNTTGRMPPDDTLEPEM